MAVLQILKFIGNKKMMKIILNLNYKTAYNKPPHNRAINCAGLAYARLWAGR
jgi:hypothetical protein